MCGWKDRCRDGNLRTYCHVSPILFGWFFVEASPTCFCIFVKCFFCNLFTTTTLHKRPDILFTCNLANGRINLPLKWETADKIFFYISNSSSQEIEYLEDFGVTLDEDEYMSVSPSRLIGF